MLHRIGLGLPFLLALLMAGVSDTHATGFTYRLVVSVNNGSGGTLDDVQVPLLTAGLDGLTDSTFFTGSGYIQPDGDDIVFIKGADVYHGFAQDLGLTDSVWWSRIEDLADGDTRDLFINMGNPGAVADTSDQGVGFFTDADILTVVDDPSIDVTNDFALEVDVEIFDMGSEAVGLELASKHAASAGYGFQLEVFSSESDWDLAADWLLGAFSGEVATDGDSITLDPASLGYSSSFGDFAQEQMVVDDFDDGDISDWSNGTDFEATTAVFQDGTHSMRLKTDRTGPAETSRSFTATTPENLFSYLLVSNDSANTLAQLELRQGASTVVAYRLIGDGAGGARFQTNESGSFVDEAIGLSTNTWYKVHMSRVRYSLTSCRFDVFFDDLKVGSNRPCAANFSNVDEAVFRSEGSAAAEYGAVDGLQVSQSDREDWSTQIGGSYEVQSLDAIGAEDGIFALRKFQNNSFPFPADFESPALAVPNRTPSRIVASMFLDNNGTGVQTVQIEPERGQNFDIVTVKFVVGDTQAGNCPSNTLVTGCFQVSSGGPTTTFFGDGLADATWYTVTLSNVDFGAQTFDLSIDSAAGNIGTASGLTFRTSQSFITHVLVSGNFGSIGTVLMAFDNIQTVDLSEGTHTTEWRPLVATGSLFAFDTIDTLATKPIGATIDLTVETGDDCATADETNHYVVPDGSGSINISGIAPARCIRLTTSFASDDLVNQPSVERYTVNGTPSEAGAINALAGPNKLDVAWDGTKDTYRLWYTTSGLTATFALTRDGFHVASDDTVTASVAANSEHLISNPMRLGVIRDIEVLSDVGVLYRNLVTNPSAELDLTGYAAYPSSVISRDTGESVFGEASVKLVSQGVESPPVEGFYFDVTGETSPSSSYTASVQCKGEGSWALQFSDDSLGPEAFYAEPAEELDELAFTSLETDAALLAGSTVRRITVTRAAGTFGDGPQTVFCDGLQVTDGLAAGVAYADGDQGSNVVWSGTAHASVTLVPEAGTEQLILDFEPANLTQTDPGDAGDGFTWESEVADLSGNLNTTTYEATFDPTGVVAEITGFQILSNAVFTGGAVETEPAFASDPAAVGNFASEEEGSGIFVHGLLSDLAESSGLGIEVMWALLMLLVVSVGALWIWRFSKSPFWTMVGCGILLAIFPLAGVVPGWTLYVAGVFMLASFLSNRLSF